MTVHNLFGQLGWLFLIAGCSSSSTTIVGVGGGGAATAGASQVGGSTNQGGARNTGATANGGVTAVGGSSAGGQAPSTGGVASPTGGQASSTGGTAPNGGAPPATGGQSPSGGGTTSSTGGTTSSTGGTTSTGGAPPATGGKSTTTGGAAPTGGAPPATGGKSTTTGGAAPTGGAPPATGGAVPTGGAGTGGAPPECTAPQSDCVGNTPRTCNSQGHWVLGTTCPAATPVCASGICQVGGPSCTGLAANCGPQGNANCCSASIVTGSAFNRNSDSSLPATISDFKLDNYEITVGRFRKFVDAGQGTQVSAPITGKGAHPNLAGSGWTAGYNAPLSADKATLLTNLKSISNPAGPSSVCLWTDAAGAYENLPMNCISWVEAFAFCVWDGGYLPTEAEWNYAAMGGTNYWTYPWGTTAPDSTLAVFGQTAPPPGTVGSKTAGNGRYGQSDLAGNVWEWYLDAYTTTPPVPCTDCAVIDPNNTSRGVRGGGFASAASSLRALDPSPYAYPYDYRAYGIGARCARRL